MSKFRYRQKHDYKTHIPQRAETEAEYKARLEADKSHRTFTPAQ